MLSRLSLLSNSRAFQQARWRIYRLKVSPTVHASQYHILSGRKLAQSIREKANDEIQAIKLKHPNFKPTLKIIQVGARPDSSTYVRMKLKASKDSNVDCIIEKLPAEITEVELLKKISDINDDDSIHGLLIQLPLPRHLDETTITNAVDFKKDVDGFHRYNAGELAKKEGNHTSYHVLLMVA